MNQNFKVATEEISLPSQGLLYPETSSLSSGKVLMKYMTAKEEDILTNNNYISQGTVIDKLLESLIVSDINYDELLVGDKEAILIAARILSYGKDYEFPYKGRIQTVDLTQLKNKNVLQDRFTKGINEFKFTLPTTSNEVTFKVLSHLDEKSIDQEVEGMLKVHPDMNTAVTTRLKHIITSVNGKREIKDIRDFVDNYLLAVDARALREEYSKVSPGVDLSVKLLNERNGEEVVDLPIGVTFFWPDTI